MINATPTPIDGQEAGPRPRPHSMHPLPLNQQTTRTQPVLLHSLIYECREGNLASAARIMTATCCNIH